MGTIKTRDDFDDDDNDDDNDDDDADDDDDDDDRLFLSDLREVPC